MILGANQPYFLPYLGYFQLINAVDKFVLSDDFQYKKHGWINRNRILSNGKIIYTYIPVAHSSENKNIDELMCVKDCSERIRSIENAYRKAPLFNIVFPIYLQIINYPDRRLNHFLFNSLKTVCNYIGIFTPIILNSENNVHTTLRGEKRVIDMCKIYNVDTYINAIGGQELYSRENFANEGITLKFIKPELRPYKQIRTQEFVPALSILDVMMNVPRDEIRDMLNDYTLI